MSKLITLSKFIDKCLNVHGNLYDYSNTNYKGYEFKVDIICKEHGLFTIKAGAHLAGQGCKLCGKRKINASRELIPEIFLEKAKIKYNNKYSYITDNLVNGSSEITVICPQHGEFTTTASRHLDRRDCKICKKENQFIKGFGRTSYAKAVSGRKSYVYLMEFKNQDEQFYKIGITVDIKDRFRRHKVDYNVSLISSKEYSDGVLTYNKELELHKKCKIFRYHPAQKFNGSSECYLPVKDVIDIFNQ